MTRVVGAEHIFYEKEVRAAEEALGDALSHGDRGEKRLAYLCLQMAEEHMTDAERRELPSDYDKSGLTNLRAKYERIKDSIEKRGMPEPALI